ncbi:hypothetical protein PINS_up007897 [Pythium insidiosum]|nr:hypothetical protein PINS_up007897 [Pythium insidiosum]
MCLRTRCCGICSRIVWDNPAFSSQEDSARLKMLVDEVSTRGVEPARAIDCPSMRQKKKRSIGDESEHPERSHHEGRKVAPEAEALLQSHDDHYNTFQEHVIDLERGTVTADPFQLETTFLDALAAISGNLRTVPLLQRNDMLRTWLKELQTQYLPSNSLYIPVANAHHRLKRIHVGESFTFSTRERVPYLLCAEVIDYVTPAMEKALQKRNSMFTSRRFTLSFWEKAGASGLNQSTTPVAERNAPLSPEAAKLGFWSESKPPTSPRVRSISQHLTTSIAQPGELLNGIIDTIVGKTPLGKTASSTSCSSAKGTAQEALLADCDTEEARGGARMNISVDTVDSHSVVSRSSRTIDSSAVEKRHGDEVWSPRSEGVASPRSPGSPYSPPSLARCDSTDVFLRTMSERDSKDLEEDEKDLPPLSSGRPDIPTVIFKERWSEKESRLRVMSPWSDCPGWRLLPVIVKSNDDLRQEQLASQLIRQFSKVFTEAKLPVFVRPYDVIAISSTSGLVEAIPDTISIDSLKRNDREYTTLIDFFRRHFGDESSSEYRTARDNFVSSLAAYSIICYLLQIKDRHNGNILLDAEGHIIHIDFGYMLSNNPGNVAFEQAPFKLTSEFVELMGGPRSATFRRFRSLCVRSFLVARKYRHRFTLLIEMTLHGNEKLPCFAGDPRGTINRFAARFQPQLDINACEDFVHSLIDASLDNWRTQWYDKYQRWFVGVF